MTGPTPHARVDLQGCIANHCHRPRSPRQEGSANEDGIPYGCHQPPGWGTDHKGYGACKLHFGNTPNGGKNAAVARTTAILNRYGTLADVDPAEALLEDVQRATAVVRYLSALVSHIDPDDLTYGLAEQTMEPASITSEDGDVMTFPKVTEKYKAGVHPLVTLLQQERKHLREVSRDAVNAGVALRTESLRAAAGDLIMDAYERVLDSLNLTPAQRALVPAAVVREMRMITGEVEP